MSDDRDFIIPADTYESLGRSMAIHLRKCDIDHRASLRQVPLITFHAVIGAIDCRVCGEREYLKVPASEAQTLDEYICNLLQQQARFFERHFASCIAAKAIA